MSALSRAPAPTSGVRWAEPLTPLEYALTDYYLSYKQNAPVSPLNSALTNASHLPESTHFETACFHTLPHTSPATPLDSALTKNIGVGGCLLSAPGSAGVSACSLGVEPMLDMRLKEAQRHGALLQDGVVEGADVEFGGEAALGFGAQLADFELAELVGEGLAGPDNVAIDFDGDVLIGLAGVVLEKLDGLLARPVHRVHPGVDHQPHRAPHFVAELAKFGVRIGVQPDVFAEPFAIQRPALDKGGVAHVLAKFRRVLHVLRQRNLQMVPGDSFVERERFHFPLRPRVQIVSVDEIAAGASGPRRTALVISGGLRRRLEIRNDADAVGQPRQLAEKMRESGIDALGDDAVPVHQIFRFVVVEARVGAQKF